MSALFSPIRLRDLELPNRIMVAPMCQYSAEDGKANDWHFTHINNLALSGAAMFCIEATHVEAIGRITPGCLGLWNDATESALRPVLASVRRHSTIAIAIQLAHAGRKASTEVPWKGGKQIAPGEANGWQTVSASDAPFMHGDVTPTALDRDGMKRVRQGFAAAFDPVNVFFRALFQERRDTGARVAQAAAHLLQFRAQEFIVVLPNDFGNARL